MISENRSTVYSKKMGIVVRNIDWVEKQTIFVIDSWAKKRIDLRVNRTKIEVLIEDVLVIVEKVNVIERVKNIRVDEVLHLSITTHFI